MKHFGDDMDDEGEAKMQRERQTEHQSGDLDGYADDELPAGWHQPVDDPACVAGGL